MKFGHLLYEIILENIELSEARPRMSEDEFIARSHAKHDTKRKEEGREPYDYSLVNFEKTIIPVDIICHEKDECGDEHGKWPQRPDHHLRGVGCPKCYGGVKMDLKRFKCKAHAVHDKKRKLKGKGPYDYSLVNLQNPKKVDIICHEKDENGIEHGEFTQPLAEHLNGKGCPKCGGGLKSNTEEFIKKSKKIHDSIRKERGETLYDYSKVNYINDITDVVITCHEKGKNGIEHGDFLQTPKNHKKGSGCSKCAKKHKRTTDEFIADARAVHDARRKINGKEPYDYSEVNFVGTGTKVIIKCDEKFKNGETHGPFLQTPNSHLQGGGCPICGELKGETDIRIILSKNNIKFTPQFQYENCTSFKKSSQNKSCRLLSFDFFLPDYNTLIEFDGVYHFVKKRTNDEFMSNVLNDREKNSYTKLKGIKLIRISYLDNKNLEEEIRNGLLSKDQLYLSKSYGKHKTGWVNDNFQPTTNFIKKYYERS